MGPQPGVVLIVEDEEVVRAFLVAVLTRAGHQVVTAASGADALECLAEQPAVDLMITDLTLPLMDGVELIRRARAMRPHLAALLISGYSLDHLTTEHVDLLQKPFSAHQLVERVAALLTSSRLS
jgi:CheY-like chemotaxis protein